MKIATTMISCPERDTMRAKTLLKLSGTDWSDKPHVIVSNVMDKGNSVGYTAFKWFLEQDADYMLYLEDDLDFNKHFRFNVETWEPLGKGKVVLASLYNPHEDAAKFMEEQENYYLMKAWKGLFICWGSQALLMSRKAVSLIADQWHTKKYDGNDHKITGIITKAGHPVYYHKPSLVQHLGAVSVARPNHNKFDSYWGKDRTHHQSPDFDLDWKRDCNTDTMDG